ncbi:MAG: hypothetical protein HYS27_03250 [Deltaproteobacteria bacterium]|nr:hypothetical protein [Deltaproteobacteria bacterium]
MTTTIKKLPTHELFDVQEREGQRAYWNKVGAAFENKDHSHSLLIYRPGLPEPRRLQLRRIDRERRPIRDGAEPKRFPTHELFAVTEVEGGPNDWKRVGVAFTNKDDSLSLILDDGVREGPKARFQMRARRDVQPSEPSPEPQSAAPRAVVRKRQAA